MLTTNNKNKYNVNLFMSPRWGLFRKGNLNPGFAPAKTAGAAPWAMIISRLRRLIYLLFFKKVEHRVANSSDNNYILTARNIQKRFGDLHVLKNTSLNVKRGEIVALIGPSGSGKSTLLRSLARLENIDSGEIYIDGDCMVNSENGAAVYAVPAMLRNIRLKIGMVFQNFPLFPHMSVLENIIEAPLSVLKMKREQAILEAEALLKKVGLAEKRESYPCALSGGQKQRAAIARALAMKPEIMLFDEPTSALDPESASGVLNVIKDLALQEKRTMVIVTHNMQFAEEIADRLVLMEHGSVSY